MHAGVIYQIYKRGERFGDSGRGDTTKPGLWTGLAKTITD